MLRSAHERAELDQELGSTELFWDRYLRYNKKGYRRFINNWTRRAWSPNCSRAWPSRSPPLCWPWGARPSAARPYHLLGNYLFWGQIWEESEGLRVAFPRPHCFIHDGAAIARDRVSMKKTAAENRELFFSSLSLSLLVLSCARFLRFPSCCSFCFAPLFFANSFLLLCTGALVFLMPLALWPI